MGRPKLAESLVPLHFRVRPAAMAWLQERARAGGVADAEAAREVLSLGKRCAEGECVHAERSRVRGERNAELLAEVAELRSMPTPAGPQPPTEWDPLPNLEATFVLEPDPRACLPLAWRGLDDRALRSRGICPEHLAELTECAHDHEDPA